MQIERIIEQIRSVVMESGLTTQQALTALNRVSQEIQTMAMSTPVVLFKECCVNSHGEVKRRAGE